MAEITNKRQLRRLIVLPYDLVVKEAFPENVQAITEFSKKTGDYPSLSATDIQVMALTYQLEKEKVGIDHLRTEPVMQKAVVTMKKVTTKMSADVTGFYRPGKSKKIEEANENVEKTVEEVLNSAIVDDEKTNQCSSQEKIDESDDENDQMDDDIMNESDKQDGNEDELDDIDDEQLTEQLQNLAMTNPVSSEDLDSVLASVTENDSDEIQAEVEDDDSGWITPSNIQVAKKQFNSDLMETKKVTVACMTTDFAMQNVLKQMNLNVSALDGRLIKQLRTFILRCYTCFKTTSIMTKKFCPKCGNNTLKKVAVSLDKNGQMKIHINPKHPLTARGKKYSLPKIKGGKHPNNPVLVDDQPMPDNRPTRLAKTKNNPLDDDYIAGECKTTAFTVIIIEL